MTPCEMCQGRSTNNEATVKVTYGLYHAFQAGRPHNVLMLCQECAGMLYEGEGSVPLKNLVTAGLAHYVLERIV